MKRMVRCACSPSRSRASATTRRRSATPEATADTGSKCELVIAAMMRARVVLPVPGGPQKISEGSRSSSMARRSNRPSPTRCSWPTNCSSLDGRILAASGACRSARTRAASANMLKGRFVRPLAFLGIVGPLSHVRSRVKGRPAFLEIQPEALVALVKADALVEAVRVHAALVAREDELVAASLLCLINGVRDKPFAVAFATRCRIDDDVFDHRPGPAAM